MSLRRSPLTPIFVLVALFLMQWLLLFNINGPTWDAVSYYAYARTVVFDRDLNFGNDYALSYPTAGEHFASKGFDRITTSTGRIENIFAVGPAVLWLPWLALLRFGAMSGLIAGVDSQAMTGYEPFFAANVAALSAVIGLLAFILSYLLAATVFSKRIALVAAATLMFTTPLLYYQFREPLYSHSAAAFSIALLIFVWWRQMRLHSFSVGHGLLLGALVGFAGLVRYQNLIYLVLPFLAMVYWWLSLPAGQRKNIWRRSLLYLVAVGLATLAVFAVQMSIWRVIYGTFFTIPYVAGTDLVNWRAPFLDELLFSSFRGLLPWMPVFFLSLIGLLGLSRREPQLAWPLLLMLVLAVYINGTTRDWFGGGGYGPRRLVSELAILVVGYAAFLQLIPSRLRSLSALILVTLLALHQWLLLRYGLAEQLGGQVRSMVPTFRWEDEPLSQFAGSLLNVLDRAIRDPLDFLLLSGSPMDLLVHQQTWPMVHGAVLVQTTLFVGLILLLLLGIKRAGFTVSKFAVPLIGSAILMLLIAELWILFLA